jgi:prevent-host-death family protein
VPDPHVGIGRVKRDISELINRVAYGGERIVLTSRGRPKAALVSIEDYRRLKQARQREELAHWEAWLAENRQLSNEILARREGEPIDIDALWDAVRAERDVRDDQIAGS